MKLISVICVFTVLVLTVSQFEGVSGKPLSFNNFLQAVGLRRRTYVGGTYVPLNGQQMPEKPLSNSEEQMKIITSGIGAVGRDCPDGTYRTASGGCQSSYVGGDW